MPTLSYSDIAAHVAAGRTDAQIAAALAASGITFRPVPLDDFRDFLRAEGLVTLGSTFAGFDGPIASAVVDPASPAPLVAGLKRLFTHVFATGRTQYTTTDPAVAAETRQLAGVLVTTGRMTAAQRDRFYALAGGEKFLGVTAADVTQCKADEAARVNAANAQAARDVLSARLNQAAGAAALSIEQNNGAAAVKAAFDTAWGV